MKYGSQKALEIALYNLGRASFFNGTFCPSLPTVYSRFFSLSSSRFQHLNEKNALGLFKNGISLLLNFIF